MKKYVKRYLSLVLTFTLVFAIPFAFTQEASAASKKTKYVTTSNTITYKNSDGSIGSTSTTNITYFKNGLAKTITYSDGSKTVYTRNKKGYIIIFKCKKCGAIRKNKAAEDDNMDLIIELSVKK